MDNKKIEKNSLPVAKQFFISTSKEVFLVLLLRNL